jgi:hypothetical protein
MTDSAANFQAVLRQARRLPARARRRLAENLLRPANTDEHTVLVSMRQFQPNTQARFQALMDRHNAGRLSPTERKELNTLVERYEALLLLNTETLLKATQPELFTKSGRLKRNRAKSLPR